MALLSVILAEAALKPVDEFLDERLFGPLGIESWQWDRDAAGHTITYAQLAMTARDLAKVGELLLDQGKRGRDQILPAE